jgi:hypothetical protein
VRILVEDNQHRSLLALLRIRLNVQQGINAIAVRTFQVDDVSVKDRAVSAPTIEFNSNPTRVSSRQQQQLQSNMSVFVIAHVEQVVHQ